MTLPKWVDDYGAYMALMVKKDVCFSCRCETHCGHSCQECESCPDCNCISCLKKETK